MIEAESLQTVFIDITSLSGSAIGSVENTDESYSDTVKAGATLVIPDINITKNDDSIETSPAAIDLDLRVIDPFPSGWDEQIAKYGRGANLVSTDGQTIVFRVGDSASIESSIFAPIRVANSLKVKNSLVDFFTLGNTNNFGNLFRFTSDIGGYEDGGVYYDLDGVVSSEGVEFANDLVLDNYTHLMIKRTLETTAIWDDAIDNALAKSFAGFDDYFVINIYNVFLFQYFGGSTVNLMDYAPFNLVFPDMWTSTTRVDFTPQAMQVRSIGRISSTDKGGLRPYLIARLHTF